MGFVQEELAETGQTVTGVFVALEDDQTIRSALAAASSIGLFSVKSKGGINEFDRERKYELLRRPAWSYWDAGARGCRIPQGPRGPSPR